MKIFALTWRAIKIVAVLLLAVIGFLNAYVALTGREPASETSDQELKEDQETIVAQGDVGLKSDSIKHKESETNDTAPVVEPLIGPEYVASEINRIKREADLLFGELLESNDRVQAVVGLTSDVLSGRDDESKNPKTIESNAYDYYKKHRDRISELQEQLALLKSRNDYAELSYRKDSGHVVLLGRYVEIKLAKAREVAKAQYEWLSFWAQYSEDRDDVTKSKERELLRKWQALQDELSEILPSSIKEDLAVLYKKGLKYYNGDGAEKDYAYAFQCFQSAAEQEFADAQFKLGVMYSEGTGVSQDYTEAAKWYRKAAEQGNATAQNKLASIYYDGQGVSQDYAEAFKWYRKAAAQGDVVAQTILGIMYAEGKGVSQNCAEATKWYRKAAEQGGLHAQYFLAQCYRLGEGVSQDYTEAAKWYRKAAEQGDADAQTSLGKLYAEGQGVSQDYAEAAKWSRMAAEQGDATAQHNLGWQYYKGKGVSQDYTEAFKWYRKAAEQGDADAQFMLGVMYTEGEGVSKDYAEAVKWHRKAAEQGDETSKEVLPLLQSILAKNNQQQDGLDQAITALGEFTDKAIGKVSEWLSSDSGPLTEEERKRRQKMDDDMMIYNTLTAPLINQAVGF